MILLIFAEAGLALTRRPMTASDVQYNDRIPRAIPFANVFFSLALFARQIILASKSFSSTI